MNTKLLNEYMQKSSENYFIYDSISKSEIVLNRKGYENIWVSISGGSDSDIIMDICSRLHAKVQYVLFNTGIEYSATLEHLDYLEEKYGVEIQREKALLSVPTGCKKYGQPFLSKHVSENIQRLQKHHFQWEDEPLADLLEKYPKCKAALRWWCNDFGLKSRFNINYHKYLKEFIIDNPPVFKISNKCCDGAKKDVAKEFVKDNDVDLMVIGIRKAEGGVRNTAYKSCFSEFTRHGCSQFRPIFYYTKQDKEQYEELFHITHSKCYSEYGLERTGCCGCPFARNFEKELEIVKQKEPKLYKAVCNIFEQSYSYTRQYLEYRERHGEYHGI